MLFTSPDGQWIAMRHGREVALQVGIAAPNPGESPVAPGALTLDRDDVDLALIGPPNVLVAVARGPAPHVVLHQPPALEAAPPLALDAPMRLAAITGPRIALVSLDGKQVLVVRAVGRALSSQVIDTASPVEFAVGLERNQLLFGLMRKLEVWDAISGRPLLRLQLQLPPPPRTVGAAQGHLWVTRPGSDEVFIYRLSDGRPFRHHAAAPIEDVICHPMSPVIVLVTARGLVRLHCFAHSLGIIDAPWTRGMPLAQLVSGDELELIGDAGDATPWRVPIGASAAPALEPIAAGKPGARILIEPMTATRSLPSAPPAPQVPVARAEPRFPARAPSAIAPSWRAPLAALGAELARGGESAIPAIAPDTELGELADRLELLEPARRALTVLYALYLVGTPAQSIARLAHALADWSEPLGQGDLGALAMLHRRGGRVALRAAVTDLLDGVSPRAIRVIGDASSQAAPRGAARLSRGGKSDVAIESELVTQLGRIAVIEGGAVSGLLEARLHGATAVAHAAPLARPLPWPRDAGLIVVVDAAPPDWVAALPAHA